MGESTLAVTEHLVPHLDPALLNLLVDVLHDVLCTAQGTSPETLESSERRLLERFCTAAFFRCNPAVQSAAVFRAAQVLGFTRHSRDWEGLAPRDRHLCLGDAKTVIVAYEQHLQRLNPEATERKCLRIANEALARTREQRIAAEVDEARRKRELDAVVGVTEHKVLGFISPKTPWGETTGGVR